MSTITGPWTRRRLGQVLAGATAAGVLLPRWSRASTPERTSLNGFGFASTGPADIYGSLHAFRVRGGEWELLSVLLNVPPGKLLMHPSLPVLYVLHDVALWGYLPRGAVSAYRFHATEGVLTPVNTQPLSLAATHPQDGAVFSRGEALFVSTAAGIYNVLRLTADGSLLPVSAIRKEIGLSAASGSPAQLRVFLHPDGETIFAVNPGQKLVNAFRTSWGEAPAIERVDFDADACAASKAAQANRRDMAPAPGGSTTSVRSSIFWPS